MPQSTGWSQRHSSYPSIVGYESEQEGRTSNARSRGTIVLNDGRPAIDLTVSHEPSLQFIQHICQACSDSSSTFISGSPVAVVNGNHDTNSIKYYY